MGWQFFILKIFILWHESGVLNACIFFFHNFRATMGGDLRESRFEFHNHSS
jgi:hypothetical protein